MKLQCCIRDEGRPLEFGVQALISNYLPLLWSKAMVISRKEKSQLMRQVWIKEMSQTKPSLKRREVANDVKTGSSPLSRDKSSGYLITELGGVRRADGMTLIRALIRNVRPCDLDVKGEAQDVDTFKSESTEAGRRFGAAHSSDEVRETEWSEGAASFRFLCVSTTTVGGAHG
jgi:hypothetical protein